MYNICDKMPFFNSIQIKRQTNWLKLNSEKLKLNS